MHFEPKVYWLFFFEGARSIAVKGAGTSFMTIVWFLICHQILPTLYLPCCLFQKIYELTFTKKCWTTLLAFVFKSQNKCPCPCFYIKRYYCLDCYIAFCYLENDGIDFERYIQFTNEKAAMWMSKVLCIFFLLSVLDFIHYNLLRDDDWFISGLWNLMVP